MLYFWTFPKDIRNPEQLEPNSSPDSALVLSNIEEDMGHNTERAQELQEELAQWRASLHQKSAEAQAIWGREALLANIIEEEMAHLDSGIGPVSLTSAAGQRN